MLIPLDYANEAVLAEVEALWTAVRPAWYWPPRHPYAAEYSWALDQLHAALGADLTGLRIIDAGGGRNAVQHLLAARVGPAGEAINVDLSAEAMSPRFAAPTILRVDLEDTGLEPGSFDAIVSVSAIEHNPWTKIVSVVRHLLGLLRPGSPLIVTVPAMEQRTWFESGGEPGGWPEPHQATWARCFCFDPTALRELERSVSDLGALTVPDTLPRWQAYRRAWRAQHADMMEHIVERCRFPYLSAGFVMRKR